MQSFSLPPAHFDIVTVSGPDATKFLQGQLTCDVESLTDDSATWGAACNNKGRVYATFLLARHHDALILVLARGLGEILATTLRKFLPFYKCALELNPSGWRCSGLAGSSATTILSMQFGALPELLKLASAASGWLCTLSTATDQYLWYTNDNAAPPFPPDTALPQGSPAQWQILDMRAGRFPFAPSDSGLYTPQELHLDKNGHVSFSKGCYTGQEIVARMHYRGKPKKQLYLLETSGCDPGEPTHGFDVTDSNGTIQGHTLKQAAMGTDGPVFALVQLPVILAGLTHALRAGTGKPVVLLPF